MSYTYLIGWTNLDKYYYGRRTARECHPDEFWVTYFTSSKLVEEFTEKYGNPDIIEIRKLFSNPKDCIKWECTVLRRLKVSKSDKWLNLVAGDLNWDTTGWSLPCSEETKNKISNSHKNRVLNKSGYTSFELLFVEIKKMVDLNTSIPKIMKKLKVSRNLIQDNFPIVMSIEYRKISRIPSDETRNILREKAIGRKSSIEGRLKLSIALTGKVKSIDHIEKIKNTKKLRRASGIYQYTHPEESKQKMRKPKANTENYKKPKSEDQKKNMAANNHLKIKCSCLECKKIISANLMNYHYKKSHEK